MSISNQQQMVANKLIKTSASMLPFQNPLQNASITSITIPLIRKAAATSNQALFNLNFQSREPINNSESDLTELSWLTNNVQIFNKGIHNSESMGHLTQPLDKNHRESYLTHSFNQNGKQKLNLPNSASSAFSNYSKILNSRNNFQISTNRLRKTQSSKVKHEPTMNEDESSFSSSYSSSSSTSSPISIQAVNTKSSPSISPSSSSSSSDVPVNKLLKDKIKHKNSGDESNTYKISPDDLLFKTCLSPVSKQESNEFKNNCGLTKPPLTLSCLIFMALQESKEKCLPVREIYEWIEEHFPFYKNASNGGWKSSIRHNLSFSKCFKKMDRNDSILNRVKQTECSSSYVLEQNGRKRRAPNSTGTCWAVSPECKSYLVQTLKKSSFWFHNSKHYPILNDYVINFTHSNLLEPTDQIKIGDHFKNSTNLTRKNTSKKLKISTPGCDLKSKLATKSKQLNDHFDDLDEDSEEEKQVNLLTFVQQQQQELCKNSYSPNSSFDSNYSNNEPKSSLTVRSNILNSFDSNDLAAAAVLASSACSSSVSSPQQKQQSKLDLSLSSSSSSLSSAFSLLSSSSSLSIHQLSPASQRNNELETDCQPKTEVEINPASINSMNLNSDLEMEVASTLVGMKFFARQQH